MTNENITVATTMIIVVIAAPLIIILVALAVAYGYAGLGVLANNAHEWYCNSVDGSYEWIEGEYTNYKDCVMPK